MAARDLFLVMMINLVWGLNFIAAKLAVESITPLAVNALRFGVVLVILCPFLRWQQGRMLGIFRVAIMLGVLHFGVIFWAMRLAGDISSMAVVSQLNVPFATLLAILMLGERVGWKRLSGVALSFTGVVLLTFDPAVFDHADAVILMAVGCVFYALSTIYMRQIRDVKAPVTQAWVALAAVIMSSLASGLLEPDPIGDIEKAGGVAFAAILFSAVFSTIIGHGGANYLLTRYEVAVIAPYWVLTAVVAISSGVVFYGDALSARMIIGAGLTLLGVTVVTLRNKSRSAEALSAKRTDADEGDAEPRAAGPSPPL